MKTNGELLAALSGGCWLANVLHSEFFPEDSPINLRASGYDTRGIRAALCTLADTLGEDMLSGKFGDVAERERAYAEKVRPIADQRGEERDRCDGASSWSYEPDDGSWCASWSIPLADIHAWSRLLRTYAGKDGSAEVRFSVAALIRIHYVFCVLRHVPPSYGRSEMERDAELLYDVHRAAYQLFGSRRIAASWNLCYAAVVRYLALNGDSAQLLWWNRRTVLNASAFFAAPFDCYRGHEEEGRRRTFVNNSRSSLSRSGDAHASWRDGHADLQLECGICFSPLSGGGGGGGGGGGVATAGHHQDRVLTACGHCFCRGCTKQWIATRARLHGMRFYDEEHAGSVVDKRSRRIRDRIHRLFGSPNDNDALEVGAFNVPCPMCRREMSFVRESYEALKGRLSKQAFVNDDE